MACSPSISRRPLAYRPSYTPPRSSSPMVASAAVPGEGREPGPVDELLELLEELNGGSGDKS